MVPLLLLMLFGIVEIGYAANIMQTLDNAAREGARWSALPSPGTQNLPAVTDVQQRVVSFAAASGITINPFNVLVNQEVDNTEGGLTTSFSQVQVRYVYKFVTPLLSALVPSITLKAAAVMRNETN